MQRSNNPFSSVRMHLGTLPHLQQPPRAPFRWFKSAILISVALCTTKFCVDKALERREIFIKAAEKDAAELQRRNIALLDMYGDGTSVEDLEKAVRSYENK